MNMNKNTEADDLAEMSLDGSEIDLNAFLPTEDSTSSEPTDTGFTGMFLSVTGKEFDGETYNLGGVNAGELQFGVSQTTGKALAGAGAVVLDEDGIAVNVTASETNLNSYKIKDSGGDVIGVLGGRKSTDPDAINIVGLRASAITGRNPQLFATAEAVSGKNATALLGATIQSGNAVSVQLDASANEIYLAASSLKTLSGFIKAVTSFTPTATNVLNMGTTSSIVGYYMRVHDFVFAWGSIGIDPTASGTLTEIRLTLPVASAMTTGSNLIGGISRTGTATGIGIVTGDSTNDQALLRFTPDIATNATYGYWFAYQIL